MPYIHVVKASRHCFFARLYLFQPGMQCIVVCDVLRCAAVVRQSMLQYGATAYVQVIQKRRQSPFACLLLFQPGMKKVWMYGREGTQVQCRRGGEEGRSKREREKETEKEFRTERWYIHSLSLPLSLPLFPPLRE